MPSSPSIYATVVLALVALPTLGLANCFESARMQEAMAQRGQVPVLTYFQHSGDQGVHKVIISLNPNTMDGFFSVSESGKICLLGSMTSVRLYKDGAVVDRSAFVPTESARKSGGINGVIHFGATERGEYPLLRAQRFLSSDPEPRNFWVAVNRQTGKGASFVSDLDGRLLPDYSKAVLPMSSAPGVTSGPMLTPVGEKLAIP